MPAIGQQMTLYLDYHIKERKSAYRAKKEDHRNKGLLLQEESYDDLPTFEFNEQVCKRNITSLMSRYVSVILRVQ